MSDHLKIYYTCMVTWRLIHKLFPAKTGLWVMCCHGPIVVVVVVVFLFSCCLQCSCVEGEQTSAFRQWHLLPKYLALNWNALWKHFFFLSPSVPMRSVNTLSHSLQLYCKFALPCRRHRRLLFFRKSINKTECLKPHRSPQSLQFETFWQNEPHTDDLAILRALMKWGWKCWSVLRVAIGENHMVIRIKKGFLLGRLKLLSKDHENLPSQSWDTLWAVWCNVVATSENLVEFSK